LERLGSEGGNPQRVVVPNDDDDDVGLRQEIKALRKAAGNVAKLKYE